MTEYWLAHIEDNHECTLVDGPHGDTEGVAKAQELINSLGLNREKREYKCVTISDVPEYNKAKSSIDYESVEILKPLIERYGK